MRLLIVLFFFAFAIIFSGCAGPGFTFIEGGAVLTNPTRTKAIFINPYKKSDGVNVRYHIYAPGSGAVIMVSPGERSAPILVPVQTPEGNVRIEYTIYKNGNKVRKYRRDISLTVGASNDVTLPKLK